MKPAAAEEARTATSLHGRRVLVVPVLPCTSCGEDMPADHRCAGPDVRRSLRLAADAVHPFPGALQAIRARISQTAASRERASSMTDPTSPARHTVPALREMAGNVRQKAEDVEAEAAELRRSADEIDAIAAQLATRQSAVPQAQAERPCATCGRPEFDDGLGWRHRDADLPCVASAPPAAPVAAGKEHEGGNTGAGEQR